VSSLAPASPPALDHVVRRCLAKDPEDRWQTARDLLLELRWIQENEASGAVLAPHPRRIRKRQISTDGGVQPVWRSNGRELFYLDPRGQLMMVTSGPDADFGVPRALFQTRLNPTPHFGEYGMAPDGQSFLFLEPVGPPPAAFAFIVNWQPDSAVK
jgi:serine/threonine protein kinase